MTDEERDEWSRKWSAEANRARYEIARSRKRLANDTEELAQHFAGGDASDSAKADAELRELCERWVATHNELLEAEAHGRDLMRQEPPV